MPGYVGVVKDMLAFEVVCFALGLEERRITLCPLDLQPFL